MSMPLWVDGGTHQEKSSPLEGVPIIKIGVTPPRKGVHVTVQAPAATEHEPASTRGTWANRLQETKTAEESTGTKPTGQNANVPSPTSQRRLPSPLAQCQVRRVRALRWHHSGLHQRSKFIAGEDILQTPLALLNFPLQRVLYCCNWHGDNCRFGFRCVPIPSSTGHWADGANRRKLQDAKLQKGCERRCK